MSAPSLDDVAATVQRRALRAGLLRGAGVGAGVSAVGAALWSLPAGLLGGAVAVAAAAWWWRVSPGRAIALADDALSLQQALLCAWDRQAEAGPFEEAQRDRVLERLSPARLEAVTPRPHWAWALPALLWAWPALIPPDVEIEPPHLAANPTGSGDAGVDGPDGGALAGGEAPLTPTPAAEPGRDPEGVSTDPERPPALADAGVGEDAGARGKGEESKVKVKGQVAGHGAQAGDTGAGGPGRRRVGRFSGESLEIELRPAQEGTPEGDRLWLAAGERAGGVSDPARPWPGRHRAIITAWMARRGERQRPREDERESERAP